MSNLESGPGKLQRFSSGDFRRAKEILLKASPDDPAANKLPKHEWEFYNRKAPSHNAEGIGDIAEAAVFSTLDHEKSPLHSFGNVQVSVELASRADDILKGIDGVLRVSSKGQELAQIGYDATTNPGAVMRKMEEALFYPKDPSRTRIILGFDISSANSPWQNVREGSFSAPSFLLLLKEAETQLRVHEDYAQKTGDTERMRRCQRELLFVHYTLQHTPEAMPKALLQDKVFVAIQKAASEILSTDPGSFRTGRAKAA